MASKKRGRKKASKRVVKKKVTQRRHRKATATVVKVAKSSLGREIELLHKIDRKVSRIDHTVNAGFHLKRKAIKAGKRRQALDTDWESVERHGME
jgi:hypothetical protein